MTKKKHNNSGRKNVKPLTTSEKILDEITKKFIFKGKPFRVKSRHGIQYEWMENKRFKNSYEIDKFIFDFVTFEMPEIHSEFRHNMIDKVLTGIFDMFDKYGEKTTNGFKKRIIKKPEDMVNYTRTRASLSVDEATREVNEKYDIDLALDGSFLIFTDRRYNEEGQPLGGLLPFFRVFQIIDSELKYAQPEFELILGVARNLYDKAKQKKEKPYLLSKEELRKAKVESSVLIPNDNGNK